MHYEEELSLAQCNGGSQRDKVESIMLHGGAMHSKGKRGNIKIPILPMKGEGRHPLAFPTTPCTQRNIQRRA